MLQAFTLLVSVYKFFQGWKTFMAGAGFILLGLGGWLVNCVVPFLDAGSVDLVAFKDFWNMSDPYWTQIVQGVAVIGFRDYMARVK